MMFGLTAWGRRFGEAMTAMPKIQGGPAAFGPLKSKIH